MNPLEELHERGIIPGKPIKIDMEAERARRIKEVGDYNAELLSRQCKPEELVISVLRRVALRVDSVVYDFSGQGGNLPIDKLEDVSFYRSFDLRGGDLIRAYLLPGKFEEMKAEGGLAYVTNNSPISVPFHGSREILPMVLVSRMLEKSERALAIELLEEGKITSRDVDWDFVKNYGSSLTDYFKEANLELIQETRRRKR